MYNNEQANDIVKANDGFAFTLEDSWGNKGNQEEFIVTWSSISLEYSKMDICEEDKDKRNMVTSLYNYVTSISTISRVYLGQKNI